MMENRTMDEDVCSIDPPPEFQDEPRCEPTEQLEKEILDDVYEICPRPTRDLFVKIQLGGHHRHASPLSTVSRISSSHNSLNTCALNHSDDSNFITQAVSHDDIFTSTSDIYTLPVDVLEPGRRLGPRPIAPLLRQWQPPKCSVVASKERSKQKRRRNVSADAQTVLAKHVQQAQKIAGKSRSVSHVIKSQALLSDVKRHSIPGVDNEPIHMTLQEVRQYLHTLYSDSNTNSVLVRSKKKVQEKRSLFTFNLKRTLCNLFRRFSSSSVSLTRCESVSSMQYISDNQLQNRALPPLPKNNTANVCTNNTESSMDFAKSIDKVKDKGWYWGPISAQAAENILSNEPDGSFIVRDSCDDHYIFSLTFKLNSYVRHARIEHDQGYFSFGSCTKFKSHTIVEFIENAVEHSRSGRYLFFLHRRPVLGPMRVQLLHPVSRFKHVQSLQHMCRFVILKLVRRDLVAELPLPQRIIDYLNAKHYYSELFIDECNDCADLDKYKC